VHEFQKGVPIYNRRWALFNNTPKLHGETWTEFKRELICASEDVDVEDWLTFLLVSGTREGDLKRILMRLHALTMLMLMQAVESYDQSELQIAMGQSLTVNSVYKKPPRTAALGQQQRQQQCLAQGTATLAVGSKTHTQVIYITRRRAIRTFA
jgi:hypothetical protein